MHNLSISGLDDKAMAELKRCSARQGASVNAPVVRLIEQGLGLRRARPARTRHDDLDALAGTWTKSQAAKFEASVAAFGEVDAALWR